MNFDILSLSVIQGISEILPISSSVNLYFFSKLFGIANFSFSLKVALHAGSLITLLVYFRREIADIFRGLFGRKSISETYFWPLVLGTIPVVVFGYLARDFVKEFDSPCIMGISSVVFGIVLVTCDKLSVKARAFKKPVSLIKSFFIGCFQTVAIFPGVSRLGICITASRMLSIERKEAINFSLMLAIPSICGSLFLEIADCIKSSNFGVFSSESMLGIVLTAVIGLVVILPCVRFMERRGFVELALYRILIGAAICLM